MQHLPGHQLQSLCQRSHVLSLWLLFQVLGRFRYWPWCCVPKHWFLLEILTDQVSMPLMPLVPLSVHRSPRAKPATPSTSGRRSRPWGFQHQLRTKRANLQNLQHHCLPKNSARNEEQEVGKDRGRELDVVVAISRGVVSKSSMWMARWPEDNLRMLAVWPSGVL